MRNIVLVCTATLIFFCFCVCTEKVMNTSIAQQFFHTWHTAYSSEGNDHEFGSNLWLQYMVQELLDRMLPYVDVTVTEEDESKNVNDETH
jgi:hypothetical protein